MTDQVKMLTLGIGAAALVGVYVAHWWWKRRLPTKWRKVGDLVDIFCFPLKSGAVVRLQSVQCEILGVRDGYMRDRIFMVVNRDGKFVTARQEPEIIRITPKIEGDKLILSAPRMEQTITINITSLAKNPKRKVKIWEHFVEVIDCGDEVADWLSRYFSNGPSLKPRLVYYPRVVATRDVRPPNKAFEKLKQKDVGALQDASSFNMIVQESVDELNTRLTKPVKPLSFRPNFVVRGGAKAYEEDTWDYVRIGEVVFRNVKPCTRCILTTVDPDTGIKDENMEPLKTLKTYRQLEPKYKRYIGDSPAMGIHLVLCSGHTVKLGDEVFVGVN